MRALNHVARLTAYELWDGSAAALPSRSAVLVAAGLAIGVALATVVATRRRDRRRRAAAELLERRLDLALEAGGMTTWLWDAGADDLTWDGRGTTVYGTVPPRSSAEWLDRIDAADREHVRAVLERSMVDRLPFQIVHRQVSPDGDQRWLELRGEPVLDDGGELLGTAGVVVDVTGERRAAAELAESQQALEQILDLTPELAVELSPDELPGRICEAATTVFDCDACGIWAVAAGTVRPVVCRPDALAEILGPTLAVADLPRLAEQLGRRLPARLAVGGGDDPVIEAAMRDVGLQSGVVVPLAEHDGGVLYLTLWWEQAPTTGLGQLAVVRRFADQVALVLAQARARAARDEVDELNQTLQSSLLPVPAVHDPDVLVTARYRPTERRILLGGDFYDVVERPDGDVAFVIGDVTGHGPGPAAVGAALRAAWRALVLNDADPQVWLRGLGASLTSYDMGPELLVTVCTGTIAADRRSAVVANAGHPPPILLSAGDTSPMDVPPGIALGLAEPGAGVTATRVPLPDGWRLLLFTDGVVEIQVGTVADRLGEEGLARWLRDQGPALRSEVLLDALVTHLERVNVGPIADDVAVVLIGRR
jgi:serine phosphatase RsbU (regulator of sigma subunit)/PAS domain-containing protein